MKLIYVCSPYSGDIKTNTKKAKAYSRYVADKGHVPIAPHLLFPQFIDEKSERDKAMAMNKEILNRCDELWIFGSEISAGMKVEIDYAKVCGKVVRQYYGRNNTFIERLKQKLKKMKGD